jgi:hypothetical protein
MLRHESGRARSAPLIQIQPFAVAT